MIHYHGTPMGGSKLDATRFLLGRHALVSYYRPDNIAIVASQCQSFVLDNGAYSLWNKGGGDVDVSSYHSWVHEWAHHPSLDWCLIPDKIDGTEQDNIDLVTLWLRIGSEVEGVPVYHYHESLEWLDYLVANFRTVALGSSGEWPTPNSKKWWVRTSVIMDRVTDSIGRPKCRLHGLRMLNPKVFGKVPLVSADSTNVAINSGAIDRFGMYTPPARHLRQDVIADRIEQYNSAPVWVRETKRRVVRRRK